MTTSTYPTNIHLLFSSVLSYYLFCPPLTYSHLLTAFLSSSFLFSDVTPSSFITSQSLHNHCSYFCFQSSYLCHFFSFFLPSTHLFRLYSHTFSSFFSFARFSFLSVHRSAIILCSSLPLMMIFSSFIMSSSHCPLFAHHYVIFHSLSFCRLPLLVTFLLSSPILYFFFFPLFPLFVLVFFFSFSLFLLFPSFFLSSCLSLVIILSPLCLHPLLILVQPRVNITCLP